MKVKVLFRFAGAAVIAAVLVLTVTGLIVKNTRTPAHQLTYQVVKDFKNISLVEANALAGTHIGEKISKPEKPPKPPPSFPQRNVSGIVQVTYTVEPDGSAKNIHVTGAAPAGYYEDKAKAKIAGTYHKPKMGEDGRLHARTESRIIHFTVPADGARESAPRQ